MDESFQRQITQRTEQEDVESALRSSGMAGRTNVHKFIQYVDRICVEFGGLRPAEVSTLPFEERHTLWLRYINWYNRAQSSKRRAAARQSPKHYTQNDVYSLWSALGGCCGYCACSLEDDDWHVEHVVPLSRGGSNGPENIILACSRCNLSKGSKLPSEWKDRWYLGG